MWDRANHIKGAEQDLLASLGAAYIELEQVTLRQQELQNQIANGKLTLDKMRTGLQTIVSEIVQSEGIPDGDFTIDFDEQRIVRKNGQIPNRVDG
jgi:hypothetical protein